MDWWNAEKAIVAQQSSTAPGTAQGALLCSCLTTYLFTEKKDLVIMGNLSRPFQLNELQLRLQMRNTLAIVKTK